MRVVIISPRPGVDSGGVERFCSLVERELRTAGWDTEVVGPRIDVPAPLSRIGFEPSLQALSAAARARRAQPDLVISNGFLGAPTGTRRIHVFHGTMLQHVLRGGEGSRRFRTRLALSGALAEALGARGATTVAVSRTSAAEVTRFYRLRIDAVIPNGVDVEMFSPGDRDAARAELGWPRHQRIALFVGRLEYRKGADLIVEACRRSGYVLAIAGQEAPAGSLHLGVLDPGRLAVAYRAASCVLFPTRYEACSYVVLEALASGVPLVTTTAGWMGDFLGDVPAYRPLIVNPQVDSVSRTLSALGDLELHDALADARAFVTKHNSLQAFGSSWTALASKLMAE